MGKSLVSVGSFLLFIFAVLLLVSNLWEFQQIVKASHPAIYRLVSIAGDMGLMVVALWMREWASKP